VLAPKSGSSGRFRPEEVPSRTFTRNRRGFDPAEVTQFLEELSAELVAWEEREEDLLRQLADAEERAANPEIDADRLSSALGHRSAEVLRSAHEEAARLVGAAEETAAAVLRDAQQQATDIQVSAEASSAERIAQAELSAGAAHEDVQADVAAILERARNDANSLLDRARERGRLMIEQAQETRRRMLTETAQRRRVLLIQIEQLRAARDQLARTVIGVRGTVDDIVSGLARADDDARAAAAAVAERVAEVEAQEVEGLEPADAGAISAGSSDGVIETETVIETERVTEAAIVVTDGRPSDERVGADGDSMVEELFARIREGRFTDSEDQLDGPPASGDDPPVDMAFAEAQPDIEQDDPISEPGTEAERLLADRDDLLDPIIARMARRLKRSMQDDQNMLLHRLRAESGEYRQELMNSEDEQRRGLVEASVDFLGDAFDAGEAFARKELGGEADAVRDVTEVNRSAVGSGAQELADTVVTLLRRRLLEEHTEGPGPTEEEAAELISAAYREWRGERIERLVGDHVIGAFSSGVRAASGKAPLRWIASGSDEACADCDDNALAEPVAEGDRFPTGHLHPPAHSGCRCLVVPTPA